jgi:hypothetical protein
MTELVNILSEHRLILIIGGIVLAGLSLIYSRVKKKEASHPEFAEQAAKEARKAKWEAVDKGELKVDEKGNVIPSGRPAVAQLSKKELKAQKTLEKMEAKEAAKRAKEDAKQAALKAKEDAKLAAKQEKERAKAIKKGKLPPDFKVPEEHAPGFMKDAKAKGPQGAPLGKDPGPFAKPPKPAPDSMLADFSSPEEMGAGGPSAQGAFSFSDSRTQAGGAPGQVPLPPPIPTGAQGAPVGYQEPQADLFVPPPQVPQPPQAPLAPPVPQAPPAPPAPQPPKAPPQAWGAIPQEGFHAIGGAEGRRAPGMVRATELKAVNPGDTEDVTVQEKLVLPRDGREGSVSFPHSKPQVAASQDPPRPMGGESEVPLEARATERTAAPAGAGAAQVLLTVTEVELPPQLPPQAPPLAPPQVRPEVEPQIRVQPVIQGDSQIAPRHAGAVIAGQTQMATPINIDQTQMPRSMKETLKSEKKTVTIQDLDVAYEKLSFMTPLEIVYYKLLRGALKQYLIFPRVSTRSVVKAASKDPEHLKIADNVLNSTNVSFIVCDVRLNIRAVVEVVDENQIPTNKDKARDYILKKAGCLLVRFYSGDKPPDVEALRLQIIGSL